MKKKTKSSTPSILQIIITLIFLILIGMIISNFSSDYSIDKTNEEFIEESNVEESNYEEEKNKEYKKPPIEIQNLSMDNTSENCVLFWEVRGATYCEFINYDKRIPVGTSSPDGGLIIDSGVYQLYCENESSKDSIITIPALRCFKTI